MTQKTPSVLKNRRKQNQIFILWQVLQKTVRTGKGVYLGFIDMEKAFDKIKRTNVWDI